MRTSSMRAAAPQTCDAPPVTAYAGLDDRALLGLMLRRSGADRESLAGTLLDRFGGLGEVVSAELGQLAGATGASPAVLADLGLLRELAVRLARAEACRRPVITSWGALLAYVRVSLAHQPREQFRALYLNRRNILLRDELTADGTVDHAPVYNSGPGRVARLGRIPDIAETRVYVATVVDCYLALTAGRGVTNSRQCAAVEGGP